MKTFSFPLVESVLTIFSVVNYVISMLSAEQTEFTPNSPDKDSSTVQRKQMESIIKEYITCARLGAVEQERSRKETRGVAVFISQ